MGTTLTNGVYLPNEGERNCYAGLKTNWEILDQKVADVTALQQAVAGALHREIVESLPTTDIDPNTIYMVLSGTSATENVYNEFMYVNNAWELIGTSATDLTNYYTKSEVDGKLLLKANASDLTSHTGDTTIHVTTADKSTWNTVTSKANDSDVVHKSRNETISGQKAFDSNTFIYNSDASATTPNLYLKSSKIEISSQGNTSGDQNLTYLDKNNTPYAYVKGAIQSNGVGVKIRSIAKDSSDNSVINELQLLAYTNGNKGVFPSYSNEVDLGISAYKWKSVYATKYYYGNDNVEFSTKFVTTDTNQTVSGQKLFDDINIVSSSSEIGVSGGNRSYKVLDKNKKILARIEGGTFSTGMAYSYWLVNNGTDGFNGVSLYQPSVNLTQLRPYDSTLSVQLGASNRYFSDCYTSKVNGLEPSSLSLPSGNASDIIDISSYITDFSGTANTYTASANGWVTISVNNCTGIQAYITGFFGDSRTRQTAGTLKFLMPICKNQTINLQIYGGSLENARFIPCRGNV